MLKRLLLATTALFSLSVVPACAMPAVIGGIPALITAGAAGGLSAGGLLLGVVATGAQWLIGKMLTPEPKQRGVKGKIEMGGDKPPKFILGEYATPGMLAYRNTLDKGSNIPEACLVDDICVSALPITNVSTKVYIGNEGCTIDDGSSWPGGFMEISEYVKGGDDGGYCLMKIHTGDQNDADNWMLDKFGSDPDRPWDDDIYLPGCGEVIVQSWYSNRGIWSGWPEFRFVVRGLKLYDPRKDSTVGGSGSHRWNNPNTHEFTKNPKVIEYNIIRGIRHDGEHVWGGDAEAYRLPLDYWFAAMNVCDEPVTKKNGDVIKRYEIGAEISFDDKPIDIINEINKSCDGYTTEFGGTYKTWCGGPGLAVGTITDDDWLITAELETSPFQPRQNTFNTCYTTYPEPRGRWEVKDGPRYQDTDALAEDGEELAIDLALPFVSENNQAQRLARSAIRDSRRQVTHAGQLPPFAWIYEPFDRLIYDSDMFGYDEDGKDFLVASKEDLPNVNQQILLREMHPGDTGWLPAYEQDFEAPALDVVKPGDLALDVSVFADQVDAPSGKDKPAIRAEWDWGGDGDLDVRYIDWRLRRTGTTKIIAQGRIAQRFIADGEALISKSVLRWGRQYDIQFEPMPFANRASVATAWKAVTMTGVSVPTGLTLTQISKQGADGKLDFFVRANWDDVPQEQNGYGVKVTIDGDARYFRADESRYRIAVKAPETVQVEVRTRAADGGTPSDWCAPVIINVVKKATGPAQATGLTWKRRPRGMRLRWNRCTDTDFKETAILRRRLVSDPWVEIDRTAGTTYLDDDETLIDGVNYKYKVVHYNRSDNAAIDSAEANGNFELIVVTDTSSTPLAAPTSISLSQGNRDLNADGTVETALKAMFTGFVPNAGNYEMQWLDSGGQTGYATAPGGTVFFPAVTTRSYQVRWRTITWNNLPSRATADALSVGQPGAWSSYTSSVTPAATVNAPPNPTGVAASGDELGFYVTWTQPTVLDYAYTEIAFRLSAGTPAASDKISSRSVNYGFVFSPTVDTNNYIYVRHVNTSGVPSSWVLATGSPVTIRNAQGVSFDSDNMNASATGSVGVGLAERTELTFSWVCDSNTTGITISLGSRTYAGITFVNNQPMSLNHMETGGGTFTVSKTGGGSWRGADLTAKAQLRL